MNLSISFIVDLVQKITAIISISLNSFLTYLIIFKSPKQLGTYKYLMIYLSWLEIIYSILDVLISPIVFSHKSILIVMVFTKNSIFSKGILAVLNGLYCTFIATTMGMFALHFIYRFFVVTGSKYLKTFRDSRLLFWLTFPVIYGSTWGAIQYFVLAPSKEIDEQLENVLLSTFDWYIQDIIYLGPYFYQIQVDGSYKLHLRSIIGSLSIWLLLASSVIAILYFGFRCYHNLTSRIRLASQNLNHLQSQVFYSLVTSTMIPILLLHLPVSIVMLFSILDKDLGTFSGITSITIALFPALDPLPAMFIIKNFRITIFGMLKITKVSHARQAIGLTEIR